MTRSEYFKRLLDSLNSGRITEDAYDAACENVDIFCDDDEEENYNAEYTNLPSWYAEVDYDDFSDPEAIAGSRFDDMNYQHYMER